MRKPVILILHTDSLIKQAEAKSFFGNFQLLQANDFQEAQRMLKRHNVSCIIADPYFKGIERLRQIQQMHALFEAIPIILYGRFPEPDLPRKYGQMGIHCCFLLESWSELLEEIPGATARYTFAPAMEIFGVDAEKVSPRLRKACAIVKHEFRDNITVTEIARRLDIHPSHLEREWQHEISFLTIKQLIIGLRLHFSTFLMRNEGLKLKNIAGLAGFMTERDFYRCFRRHMGVTASDFRRQFTVNDFQTVYWQWRKQNRSRGKSCW